MLLISSVKKLVNHVYSLFERLDDLFENKFQQTNIISLSRFRMTKSNFCSYAIFINHAKQQKEIKETGAINLVTTF